MRSLTQVRRLQLENGWKLTAPNGQAVEYIRRHAHDNRPFTTDIGPLDMGERFTAQQITATSPSGQPLDVVMTMWRHTPMYHVVVSDSITACGRENCGYTDRTVNQIPADSVCPVCRPYTGVPRPPRPERQWIHDHGSTLMHIARSERSTACALYCTPGDHVRFGPLARTADSDLADDAERCEACMKSQDHIDHIESWRYQ